MNASDKDSAGVDQRFFSALEILDCSLGRVLLGALVKQFGEHRNTNASQGLMTIPMTLASSATSPLSSVAPRWFGASSQCCRIAVRDPKSGVAESAFRAGSGFCQ